MGEQKQPRTFRRACLAPRGWDDNPPLTKGEGLSAIFQVATWPIDEPSRISRSYVASMCVQRPTFRLLYNTTAVSQQFSPYSSTYE